MPLVADLSQVVPQLVALRQFDGIIELALKVRCCEWLENVMRRVSGLVWTEMVGLDVLITWSDIGVVNHYPVGFTPCSFRSSWT